MKKEFQYTFLTKVCPICKVDTVKDFWTMDGIKLHENECYCPLCKQKFDTVITEDPAWQKVVHDGALHILQSEERWFIQTIQEKDLIKKHGVQAHWFSPGSKVYIEPAPLYNEEIKDFLQKYQSADTTLVYIPNSHLQRLYFFVPSSAIC